MQNNIIRRTQTHSDVFRCWWQQYKTSKKKEDIKTEQIYTMFASDVLCGSPEKPTFTIAMSCEWP